MDDTLIRTGTGGDGARMERRKRPDHVAYAEHPGEGENA